jgi:putative ABC transport system permease protein
MFDKEEAIGRWKNALRKSPAMEDGDLAELEGYLRDKIDDLVGKGMSQEDAFEKAAGEFARPGRLDRDFYWAQTRRPGRRPPWQAPRFMPSLLWNYLKSGLRHFRRQKAYSLINIFGLALGLAVFSICALTAYVGFHYDAFHKNAGRMYGVVQIVPSGAQGDQHTAITPGPLAPALPREFPEVEEAVRFVPASRKIVRFEAKKFYEDRILYADRRFLSFFSFDRIAGDMDTALAEPNSVVLTETAAARYFGAADPMGKHLIFVDDSDRIITGVIKDVPFDSSVQFDFLISLTALPDRQLNDWRTNIVSSFVLLKPGTDRRRLEAKLTAFAIKARPGDPDSPKGLYLLPLTSFFHRPFDLQSYLASNSPVELYIAITFGVIFLLLVSVNYTSLAIARCLTRVKEVGVRKVVGAGRKQLLVQFLGESVFLSFMAWLVSWPLFELLRQAYASLFGKAEGAALALSKHPLLVLVIAAAALLVGVASGLYPAFLLTAIRPARILRGNLSRGKKGTRARKILMTVQFVIAIFFVLSSIAVRSQSRRLIEQDLGFSRANVLVVPIGRESRALIGPLRDTLRRQPGISSVSGASFLPVKAGGRARVLPEGASAQDAGLMDALSVDEGFLETMGVGLQAGRYFSQDDSRSGQNRFILNAKAVRQLGWMEPLGKTLTVGSQTGTVVGVVRDFHFCNLIFPIPPTVLTLSPESNRYLFIKYAGTSREASVRSIVEKAWEAHAPLVPFEAWRLDNVFNEAYGDINNVSLMFGAIGLFTILFSCLGMLGLVSFILDSKTKEIGIRKVLGAGPARILGQLMKEFISLVAIADAVGIAAACGIWSRVFRLYAYSANVQMGFYLATALLSLLVVAAAILSKVVSAARRNPVESLKYE